MSLRVGERGSGGQRAGHGRTHIDLVAVVVHA